MMHRIPPLPAPGAHTRISNDAGVAIAELATFIAAHPRLCVLTGAGLSTASGIPDYRGSDGQWKRRPPITWQAFSGDAAVRNRYWARAWLGWQVLARAHPNGAHHALARLDRSGHVHGLITQNVDNLHQRAGHSAVIDLHGNLVRVICLGCAAVFDREAVQAQIAAAHPHWRPAAARAAPDGDADLDDASLVGFTAPACLHCGGILKPDVVFFGENVPAERVQQACDTLADCDALLVIGSSLLVYSGYRFARQAAAAGQPIALLTLGRTRADDLAHFKWDVDCQTVLGNL